MTKQENRDLLKEKLILVLPVVMAVIFAFAPSYVFAEQCLSSVSTSTSSSRVTTGTSVTITVSTTGTSCTINTLALVSSPSLTVNDPANGQYSGFSAGTTKSFAVTAGTSGTYTYYARGTTSSGSVDSTSQIIEFISPSDLTVSSSPSSASVTEGNTFSLTVSIQNPQSSAVTTSYTLNLPSGLTRQSGDPTSSSGTAVSGSGTKTLSFTIKHSTCFTGSKSITFDVGGSTGVTSVSVSGNSTCGAGSSNASSSSSSSGGGGTSTTSAVVTEIHTFATVKEGETVVKTFTNAVLNLKTLSITVNKQAKDVKIVTSNLGTNKPPSVTTPSGVIFQYLNFTVSNLPDSNIKSAELRFIVSDAWISQNGVARPDIVLQRYENGAWRELATTHTGGTEHVAKLPGFSIFAITGKKATVTQPQANQTQQPPQPPQEQPAEGQPSEEGLLLPSIILPAVNIPIEGWYIAVVFIIVIIIGYFHYHHPKTKIRPEKTK